MWGDGAVTCAGDAHAHTGGHCGDTCAALGRPPRGTRLHTRAHAPGHTHAGSSVPPACHVQRCACHLCVAARMSRIEQATGVPRRTHAEVSRATCVPWHTRAEASVPPARHGTHAEGCVPPACHNTRVEVSVSRHTHAEVSVAAACRRCASARACRGERANTRVPTPTCPPHTPDVPPSVPPCPQYLYWQEVPFPSWQRCLCRPARWARHSPSASASPSSALSSRAVGRALPSAGEQHVSPRRARPPPGTRTMPHSLRSPRPSPRSRPAGPLSWLPPTPGLSQLGGAQPRSQWQCPWLLHTWVGDTSSAQLSSCGAGPRCQRPLPSPALTPCPWHLLWHCWSPSMETFWHRCWRHTCGGWVSALGDSPQALPSCPIAHLPGPTGGARQHHGRVGHILIPGQGGPLAEPFWAVPTGAATLALQHSTAGVPAGTEGSGQGARQGGHGEGWGPHSLLGASDIGAIGELPAVPTFVPS